MLAGRCTLTALPRGALTRESARARGEGRGAKAAYPRSTVSSLAMSWRDALKTAASPLAARERPPSASHVGTRHHGHHRDDDLIPRDGADAPTTIPPRAAPSHLCPPEPRFSPTFSHLSRVTHRLLTHGTDAQAG